VTADQANVFAVNLKRLKDERGCSWRDIADALGHRNTRYAMLLASGKNEPRMETVRTLATFFGVTPASMLEERS
jgi:transcriptional regulator with XRE-family HTH domain